MNNEVGNLLVAQTAILQQAYDKKLPHLCILNGVQSVNKVKQLGVLMQEGRVTHRILRCEQVEQIRQALWAFRRDLEEQSGGMSTQNMVCSIVICSLAQHQPLMAHMIDSYKSSTRMTVRVLFIYICQQQSQYAAQKKRIRSMATFAQLLNLDPQVIRYSSKNSRAIQRIIYSYECHPILLAQIDGFLAEVKQMEADYLNRLAKPHDGIFYDERTDKKRILCMRRALNAIEQINSSRNGTQKSCLRQDRQSITNFISLVEAFGVSKQPIRQLRLSLRNGRFEQQLRHKLVDDRILKVIRWIMSKPADLSILMYLSVVLKVTNSLRPVEPSLLNNYVYSVVDKCQIQQVLHGENDWFRNKSYLICYHNIEGHPTTQQQVILRIRINSTDHVKYSSKYNMIIQPLALFQRTATSNQQIALALNTTQAHFTKVDEHALYLPALAGMRYIHIQSITRKLASMVSLHQFKWVELCFRNLLYQILQMKLDLRNHKRVSYQLVCMPYVKQYQNLPQQHKQNIHVALLGLAEVFSLQGKWGLAVHCCQISHFLITQFNHQFQNSLKALRESEMSINEIKKSDAFWYFTNLSIRLAHCNILLGQPVRGLQYISSCLLLLPCFKQCTEQEFQSYLAKADFKKIRLNRDKTGMEIVCRLLNALCFVLVHLNLFKLAGPILKLLQKNTQKQSHSKVSQQILNQTKAFYLERLRVHKGKQKDISAVEEHKCITNQLTCYESILKLNNNLTTSKKLLLKMKIARCEYSLGRRRQAIKCYKECIQNSQPCNNSDSIFFQCILESIECLRLQRKFDQCCDLYEMARDKIFQIVCCKDFPRNSGEMRTQALHQIRQTIYMEYLDLLRQMGQYLSYEVIYAEFHQNPVLINA